MPVYSWSHNSRCCSPDSNRAFPVHRPRALLLKQAARSISIAQLMYLIKETKLRGFSPQVNYSDRRTAACRRSCCQVLQTEGVARSAQRIPTAVNLGFVDPEPLLFHSSSPSVILVRLSGPRSRPTTSQKIW
jgi:hypothetical protein